MPTIPLTERAQIIAEKFSRPFQLKNSGDTPVFVGLDPFGVGATVSSGNKDHTIVPGGFLGLMPSNPQAPNNVYLCVGPGETGEVEQIYDSSGAYSPGPSVVSVNIESELLDSQIFGNPHANSYTALYALGNAPALLINFVGDPGPIDPLIEVVLTVIWLADDQISPITSDSARCSQTGRITWNVPRKSNYARLSIVWTNVNTSPILSVFTSHIAVEEYEHMFLPDMAVLRTGATAMTVTFSANMLMCSITGTTANLRSFVGIPHIKGEATVGGSGATTVTYIGIQDQSNSRVFFTSPTAISGILAMNIPVVLAKRPLYWEMQTDNTAGRAISIQFLN